MSVKTGWLLFVAAVLPLAANAGGAVDFALSDTSVRLEHEAVRNGTSAHITTGVLYSERYSSDSTFAVSVGFNAVDATLQNRELIGGIGFKGYFFEDRVDAGGAVAVGGFLRWNPDFMNGLGAEGSLYYAPQIMSFNRLDGFQDVQARLTYKVLPRARILIGWHDVSAYRGSSNVKVDNALHIGFRMNY